MKKILTILLIASLSLILISCNIDNLIGYEKPNIQEDKKLNIDKKEGGLGGDSVIDENEIEPDINYVDISEDSNLTDFYLIQNDDKKDISLQESSKNRRENLDIDQFSNSINLAGRVHMYATVIPEEIDVDIQYKQYDIPFDYLLITAESTNIYTNPSFDSEILGKANQFSKIKLEGKTAFNNARDTNEWYLISWLENGNIVHGYVSADSGTARTFRFDDMLDHIVKLENELNKYSYGYISNYKNINGTPPVKNGKALDEFGIQAYQSAPAYYTLEDENNFRYFPDGMIVFIIDEENKHFKVKNLVYEGEYWIPKQYISFDNNLERLDKVVVVDKTNQNQALFENRNGTWTMISYTLATTGMPAENRYETPTGYFKVLQKRERFYYLNSSTKEIGGYAPYGTRFSAGAYIHGIPVNYEKKDGENVDPGMKEYLITIGTTPRSAKCVRNYTSHAKFVYDWVNTKDTAVIIID